MNSCWPLFSDNNNNSLQITINILVKTRTCLTVARPQLLGDDNCSPGPGLNAVGDSEFQGR